MADYAELGGVRTWYDEHGEGEPLVLMHGGLVDARFFDKNIGSGDRAADGAARVGRHRQPDAGHVQRRRPGEHGACGRHLRRDPERRAGRRPRQSQFLLQEKPDLCAIIVDFLTNDPVSTVAPIRRATEGNH